VKAQTHVEAVDAGDDAGVKGWHERFVRRERDGHENGGGVEALTTVLRAWGGHRRSAVGL